MRHTRRHVPQRTPSDRCTCCQPTCVQLFWQNKELTAADDSKTLLELNLHTGFSLSVSNLGCLIAPCISIAHRASCSCSCPACLLPSLPLSAAATDGPALPFPAMRYCCPHMLLLQLTARGAINPTSVLPLLSPTSAGLRPVC